MTTRTRLTLSLLSGALIGGAVTAYAATVRHAVLAAAAAKPAAGAQHVSVNSTLTAGFIVTTLAVSLLVFALTSIRAYRRDRRQATPRPGRRGAGGYSDYGGGW